MMDYLLITPARNEENNLPLAAQSVLKQSRRPAVWLIVNDGSTDRTQQIIDRLIATHSWIIARSLPIGEGGLGKHFAEVVRFGFSQLQLHAEQLGVSYDLIGKIDADVVFDESCFSDLVREFERDARLGVASPRLVVRDERLPDKNQSEKDLAFGDHPTDGVRLYRRQCFEEIGGMQIVRGPETVAEAKAKLRGWRLRRIDHIQARLSRKSHSSTSLWSRWVMNGSEFHYLGFHPLLVLGHFFYESLFGRPRYLCLAYGWGYLQAALLRQPRIEDEEVLFYFGSQRWREVWPQIPQLLRRGLDRRIAR